MKRGFSPAQQAPFREMVQHAWVAFCGLAGREPGKKCERDWYEGQLEAATGYRSTTECNRMGDFDKAMAHFEALWGGGIERQLGQENGHYKRIMEGAHRVAPEFECAEAYLCAIAARLRGRPVARLSDLDDAEALQVRTELVRQVRRQRKRGDRTDRPRSSREDRPF